MDYFNIQIASNLTGVSIHTLRAWEKRYHTVTPTRSQSGHRLYSEKDIKKLKALNNLCSFGHNIGSIANKNLNELEDLLYKHGVHEKVKTSEYPLKSRPEQAKKILNHLLLALENYRLDIISHELYNLKMTLSLRELALNIISPLMGQVGKKVFENTLTIAQEHALSSVVRFHLGKFLYKSYSEKNKSGDLIIIATPENDYHEFGIILASLLCIHYERNFFYLGPSLPAETLSQATQSIKGTQIILGTTEATCPNDSPFLTDYINTVLSKINKKTKFFLGGPGFFDTTKFKKYDNFNYLPTLNHLDLFLQK